MFEGFFIKNGANTIDMTQKRQIYPKNHSKVCIHNHYWVHMEDYKQKEVVKYSVWPVVPHYNSEMIAAPL